MEMGKSVLVIDTPENCLDCPLLNGSDECSVQSEDANTNADCFAALEAGCPLKELPKKKTVCGTYPQPDGVVPSYKTGWNDCIDEILKGA